MNIVITGSESFIGKELISHALGKGIEVLGLDNAQSEHPKFRKADIRSRDIATMIPENTDALIHLAALSRNDDCKDNAYACFDVNVMGTLNLIEAARIKHVRQFIFASSEWVYDSFLDSQEKDEESPVDISKLTSEYALSKIVGEMNLRQKYQHGFCPVTILRFGIVYGPRKANWSAVESLFHSVQTDREISVGSLQTARRFIHVSDIASGILKAIGLPGFQVINLQGDRLISLGEIIEASSKILGKAPKISETNPSGRNVRNVSNQKARQMLHWKPEIDLEAGLQSLIHFNME